MKNSNHERVGQQELASPTGRGQAAMALRRGRRAPTQSQILHSRTYYSRPVSQMQSSGQMRSPGSDAPRLCAPPETMALASSGHTATTCLLCLSLGTLRAGDAGVEEKVHFWSQHPFLPEASAFLGWVGKAPKPPAGAGYTHHQIRLCLA